MGIGGAAVFSLVVVACEFMRARYRAWWMSTDGPALWCAGISGMRHHPQDL